MMRTLALLGATGSIGDSTLDVVARHAPRLRVAALAAHRNWRKLAALCARFRPHVAALLDAEAARELASALRAEGIDTRVVSGPQGLIQVATCAEADTVLAAIVGAAGLSPTLAAARAGKRILLANKEALVVGGELFMSAAREGHATLLPIDSEHNAIFQCLPAGYARDPGAAGVRRLLLTASGGPFRERPLAELAHVSPEEACAHPNWSMGRKISVDSATMMNKGLEVIEAHRLFGVAARAIDVVVHPQSVVHSLVEYADGSVLAQLGHPDMRTPIAHALACPDRIDVGVSPLDLPRLGQLTFEAPDHARFPSLRLACEALDAGAYATITLNAANEVAVAAFLGRQLAFTAIAQTVHSILEATPATGIRAIDDALECDARARRATCRMLGLPAVLASSPLAA